MLSRWEFNLLSGLGMLALMFVASNGWLFMTNRDAQSQLAQRQQYVQQTVPLESLYRDIVKALAEMAVKPSDRQVLDMLGGQGINISLNPPAATPASP